MEFSTATRAEFERLLTRYPTRQAALLPTLRLVERDFGCISNDGIRYAADLLGLAPAKVMGVVSFYTHYRRPSDGKYVIQVCSTLPCALRGCGGLLSMLSKKLGIEAGETTPDRRFTLKKVECLAACDIAPMMTVNDEYYGPIDSEAKLNEVLEKLP